MKYLLSMIELSWFSENNGVRGELILLKKYFMLA